MSNDMGEIYTPPVGSLKMGETGLYVGCPETLLLFRVVLFLPSGIRKGCLGL